MIVSRLKRLAFQVLHCTLDFQLFPLNLASARRELVHARLRQLAIDLLFALRPGGLLGIDVGFNASARTMCGPCKAR